MTIRPMLTPAALHPTQEIRQVKVNPKKNNIVSSFVDQFLRKKKTTFILNSRKRCHYVHDLL